MSQTHMLWANNLRVDRVARLAKYLMGLPENKTYEITVKEKRDKRSNSQNAYLWGCVYPTLLQEGGETLAGFTDEDLHEFYLGLHFGTETRKIGGRTHIKPKRRSHNLDTKEFPEYWESIHRHAAMLGIAIPDPDPEWFRKERAA